MFWVLALCQSQRQGASTWNISFRNSFWWPIYIINLVDKNKLHVNSMNRAKFDLKDSKSSAYRPKVLFFTCIIVRSVNVPAWRIWILAEWYCPAVWTLVSLLCNLTWIVQFTEWFKTDLCLNVVIFINLWIFYVWHGINETFCCKSIIGFLMNWKERRNWSLKLSHTW